MDFAYSPHRETGGTMHLPSPTHHGYRLEGAHFNSIQQLRRSLSRSPSKPSRFQLRTSKTDGSGSAISPLALSRAFSPKPHKPTSPIADSPFTPQAPPTTKKKFSLRRAAPFRSSPRNRTTTAKSPRRALVDSTDLGNSKPFVSRPIFGEENMPAPARKTSSEFWEKSDSKRFDLDDKPIKFEFSRSQHMSSNAPGANCFLPAQQSPLKRRDVNMSFDSTSGDTPNPKRRSLHAALPSSGFDLSIFETPVSRPAVEEPQQACDTELGPQFSTPVSNTHSPVRRTPSLRRTVSQRTSSNASRSKPTMDGEFARPGLAASKSRNRMSLDGSFITSSSVVESPFTRPAPNQPFLRGSTSSHQRHPLANTVTASSSSPFPPTATPIKHAHAKSLPIGAPRPQYSQESDQSGSFATPFHAKMAQLHPGPLVRSTGGLISKKNRNVDEPAGYVMPGTPSKDKRMSFPPAAADSPSTNRCSTSSLFRLPVQSRPEFGLASTPINPHTNVFNLSSRTRARPFNSWGSSSLQRRGSFLSADEDADVDENSTSPTANRMTDSQSSADDMPPTPTKHGDGSGRRSKENSLRRTFLLRSRGSVNANTFTAPENQGIDIPTTSVTDNTTAFGASPHTPNESFAPPDASKLSISGPRRDSLPFNNSFAGSAFPPMTPTTPRDHSSFFAPNHAAIPIGLTKNDVDQSLSSRFHDVKKLDGAEGEFSEVFKVSRPVSHGSPHTSPPGSQFWVVKKSKKPYTGNKDRERKMQEVRALQALRGNEHVLTFENCWEEFDHLYIQTEYCEGGNLQHFLNEHGRMSRLDDFRIWKILLELSLGLKFVHDTGYIHLDLKPANILIDFGGALKIADFGLASEWPAAKHIDGEGDRHYLAPETLEGRFDKPADIFGLGVMLIEIASNSMLPEYGETWTRLRSGELAGLVPSLTWSEDSALSRDSNGDPIPRPKDISEDSLFTSDEASSDAAAHLQEQLKREELDKAPSFMLEDEDPDALIHVVTAMMNPDPDARPTAEQVSLCFGCRWVDQKRRAGATIYEGNFGPSDDILATYSEHPDAMDIS